MTILHINNLHSSIKNDKILNGVNLEIKKGSIHAIMGPNGSGKSTLANILSGNNLYHIDNGTITFKNHNLTHLSPEKISLLGLFLAFQHPISIPGVNNAYFLKEALNAKRKFLGQKNIDAIDFMNLIQTKMKYLNMNEKFLNYNLNDGFSGGEKKLNEVLQILILKPDLIILDEIDSGLDIDSLAMVSKAINSIKTMHNSILIITHYQRLLNYIIPDFIHILYKGKIVKSGNKELSHTLEKKGYSWLDI